MAEHDALAADLRKKAEALNIAIVAFNQAIGPLSQAVGNALEDYNSATLPALAPTRLHGGFGPPAAVMTATMMRPIRISRTLR